VTGNKNKNKNNNNNNNLLNSLLVSASDDIVAIKPVVCKRRLGSA
jgi:hypothetical protein